MVKLLSFLSIRQFRQHKTLYAICVLSLSLGVALVVSMDLALQSSRKALEKINQIEWTGATHKITAKGRALKDEEVLSIMKQFPSISFAPMIRAYVASDRFDGEIFTLIGIDPFLEKDVRKNNADLIEGDSDLLRSFLLEPNHVFTSKSNMKRFHISDGDVLSVKISGKSAKLNIQSFDETKSKRTSSWFDSVLVADIATVQELSDRIGQIDSVYVHLSPTEEIFIKSFLPSTFTLTDIQTVLNGSKEMTGSFEFSLVALSLLGLLVSAFLIFSALYFLVTERIPQLGLLKVLGLRSNDIFYMIAVEAICIGFAGAILGIPLGYVIGKFSVLLVSHTLRDLYWSVHVSHVYTSFRTIALGFGMAILFSMLGAFFPAIYAKSMSHTQSAQQSWTLQNQSRFLKGSAFLGLVSTGFYFFLLYINHSVAGAFVSALLAVVVFTTAIPLLLSFLFFISKKWNGSWSTFLGLRQGQGGMFITWFGTASLAIALAMSLAIAQMTYSFRSALTRWMDQVVTGDVFVSPDDIYGGNSSDQTFVVDPRVVDLVEKNPLVKSISYLVVGKLKTTHGEIPFGAIQKKNDVEEYEMWKLFVPKEKLKVAFHSGGVLISEPLARRKNWLSPTSITLSTPSGEKTVPVLGIFREYGNSLGVIHIDRDIYQQWWHDSRVSALSVLLNQSQDLARFVSDIREKTLGLQLLKIQPNHDLKTEALRIFDQTFEVTRSLKWVSVLIALLGLFSAQGARNLRMMKDIDLLRTLGVAKKDFQKMKWLDAFIHAIVACCIAIVLGCVLTWILIDVIQVRAFGWSFDMILSHHDLLMTIAFSFAGVFLVTILGVSNRFQDPEARE